jgi:hypothetical protein
MLTTKKIESILNAAFPKLPNKVAKFVKGLGGNDKAFLKTLTENSVVKAFKAKNVKPEAPKIQGSKPKSKETCKSKKTKPEVKPFAKVGIYDAIEACLRKASAKKPATRTTILEHILSQFPDRDEIKTKHTIGAALSWALTERRGVTVSKGDRGEYWIADKSTKPEAKKTRKVA